MQGQGGLTRARLRGELGLSQQPLRRAMWGHSTHNWPLGVSTPWVRGPAPGAGMRGGCEEAHKPVRQRAGDARRR